MLDPAPAYRLSASLRSFGRVTDRPDHGTVLLSGIVGSTAYGLAGPASDIDRLGVFAAPTAHLHGLHSPKETHTSTAPDRTMHEAAKWCRLALGGNPTASELVWLPDELYETRTGLGDELIGIRSAFLSAPRVRQAYLGYAGQQFERLKRRGDGSFDAGARSRVAKHARHLARLLYQGRELYATGHMPVRLTDPQWYLDFGERVAGGDLAAATALLHEAQAAFDAARTPLPDQPDEVTVEAWLLRVRAANWEPEPSGDVFLVDVDGTLAINTGRSPYAWTRVGEDEPNTPVVTVVRALAAAGHRIVYVSGRSEVCRSATNAWIAANVGVAGEALLMRQARDNRPDQVVKREIYRRYVRPNYAVTAVLDDRAKVVRMWRDLGLTVMQVADGDF